jgi:predicted phage-related endonuclease
MSKLPSLPIETITTLEGRALSPEEWALERNRDFTLGASDLPIIARVRGSVVKLWYQKKGSVGDEADAPEQAWWGKALESLIIQRFEHETGEKIVRRQVFVRHSQHPWLAATLDCLTQTGEAIELKLLTAFGHEEGDGAWWNPAHPPRKWVVQAHQQMAITGQRHLRIAVFYSPTATFLILTIKWDEAIWQKLFRAASEFLESLLLDQPPTDFVADDDALISRMHRGQADGPELELDDEDLEASVRVYCETEHLGALEADRKKARAAILQALGNSTRATIAGYTIVRKATEKTTRLEITPPLKITLREPEAPKQPETVGTWLTGHLKSLTVDDFSRPPVIRPATPAPTAADLQEFSARVRFIANDSTLPHEVLIRTDEADGPVWVVAEKDWMLNPRLWGLRPWGSRRNAVAFSLEAARDLCADYPSILERATLERLPSPALQGAQS